MTALTTVPPTLALARTALPRHLISRTTLRTSLAARHCNFCSSALARSTSAAAASDADTRWKAAVVPHRGVVEVSGRDTVKLLQGLVSNDVKALESTPSSSPTLVYAGFMNPQGRMLADVFVHRQAPLEDGSPRWLLDLDSRTLPSLLSFVKKFKLRSKVKLADVSGAYSVVQAWSPSSSAPPTDLTERLSVDPRCPAIGLRGVLPTADGLDFSGTVSAEGDEYTLHRIVNGVAEGALDFPEAASLPLENNLDYMHGVDFRKGCYVGQELTARTHHTGVVRKRIVPVSLYLPNTPPPKSIDEIDRAFASELPSHLAEVRSRPIVAQDAAGGGKPARGKAAGKFTAGVHNVGLACLRLEQVRRWADAQAADASGDGLEMSVVAADGETTLFVRPWIPTWWPKEEESLPSDADE